VMYTQLLLENAPYMYVSYNSAVRYVDSMMPGKACVPAWDCDSGALSEETNPGDMRMLGGNPLFDELKDSETESSEKVRVERSKKRRGFEKRMAEKAVKQIEKQSADMRFLCSTLSEAVEQVSIRRRVWFSPIGREVQIRKTFFLDSYSQVFESRVIYEVELSRESVKLVQQQFSFPSQYIRGKFYFYCHSSEEKSYQGQVGGKGHLHTGLITKTFVPQLDSSKMSVVIRGMRILLQTERGEVLYIADFSDTKQNCLDFCSRAFSYGPPLNRDFIWEIWPSMASLKAKPSSFYGKMGWPP